MYQEVDVDDDHDDDGTAGAFFGLRLAVNPVKTAVVRRSANPTQTRGPRAHRAEERTLGIRDRGWPSPVGSFRRLTYFGPRQRRHCLSSSAVGL